MNRMKWGVLLAAAAILSGCAETSDDGYTDTCVEGAKACASAVAYKTCVGGIWSGMIPCNNGEVCADGACVAGSKPAECVNNKRECTSATSYKICVSGVWSEAQKCGPKLICDDGDCVEDASSGVACLAGFKGCSADGRLQECDANGYLKTSDCPVGTQCVKGSCVDPNETANLCNVSEKATCSDDNTRRYCGLDGKYATETCLNGCTDGKCNECNSNEAASCSDNKTRKYCENGSYKTESCSKGCTDGKCNECSTTDAATCTSSTTLKYCANGTYKTETCSGTCSGGKCTTTECNASDAATCSGSFTRKYCTSAGKYETETCTYGCTGGKCNACGTSTAATCSDNKTRKYCENGNYKTETCVNGCVDGSCRSTAIPTVGSACSESTFDTVCTDSTRYYCDSTTNKVASSACSSSMVTCATMPYGQDCVYNSSVCSKEGEKLFFAGDDCSEGVLFYVTCQKGVDGKLYGVLDVALSVCDGTSRVYCANATDVNSTVENCSSCSYDASKYTATCTGATTTPTGSSTHKVGESCTSQDAYKMGCDGNTLLYCDGSKYVAYQNCAATAGYYCDEQAYYGFADCVESCTENNTVVDHASACTYYSADSAYEFEIKVCEMGDSGKLGTFGGYYAQSYCFTSGSTKTDYYCSSSSLSTKTCSTCTNALDNTTGTYVATCK